MNIKHRLKKLENEVVDHSIVCACYPQVRVEWYKADLGEDSETSEPVLMDEPVPDVCLNCGKVVEKRKIILQLCDQTTPDRFPEEWQRNRNN